METSVINWWLKESWHESSAHEGLRLFRIPCCALGRFLENPQSNVAWEQRLGWLNSSHKLQKHWQNRRWADGTRVEYFPRIQYVAAQWRSQKFTVQIGMKHQKISQEEFYLCRCSTTFPVEPKTMKKNVWQMLNSYLCMQEDLFGKGQWSFIGPGSEKKWYSIKEDSPQRNLGQNCRKDAIGIRWERMSNFPRYEPIVQRSTQKQRTLKIVDALLCRFGNDWDYFSHNCFCKSAQFLRSSRRNVWRIRISSR